ncbi:MAG: DUF4277 domain-containing protein [Oligoflexia bacterium]|nr:DUF4277 domain-containing protein [Oligoflexia bacterium]
MSQIITGTHLDIVNVKRMDHLGVVAGIANKINLVEKIDKRLPAP